MGEEFIQEPTRCRSCFSFLFCFWRCSCVTSIHSCLPASLRAASILAQLGAPFLASVYPRYPLSWRKYPGLWLTAEVFPALLSRFTSFVSVLVTVRPFYVAGFRNDETLGLITGIVIVMM
jgi:hypothetical protein